MASSGCLVVGVHGTNRHAVGILNDFDEQFVVVIVASPKAFDSHFVARRGARLNLPVSIDYFERLTSLQTSLPMEVVFGEYRVPSVLRAIGRNGYLYFVPIRILTGFSSLCVLLPRRREKKPDRWRRPVTAIGGEIGMRRADSESVVV